MKPLYKCKINIKINEFDSKDRILDDTFKSLEKSNRFSTNNSWFNYKIKRLASDDLLQICMRCDILTFAKSVMALEANEGVLYSILSTSAVRVN